MIEEFKNKIKDQYRKLREETFYSRLFGNALISFVGEGGAAVIAFITTVILIRLIGNANYGILTVAYTFMSVMDTLVNFQSWKGIITFGGEAIEKEDYRVLESYIKAGSIIDFVTAVLGTVAAIFVAYTFGHLFSWNQDTIRAIYWFSFIIMFNFTGTSVGVIRLLNSFRMFSVFRIVHASLKLVGVIVLVFIFDGGLMGAVVGFTIGEILGYLFLFVEFLYLVHKDENISISGILKSPIKGVWKNFFSFTFWTSMTASVDIPVQHFDVLILSSISYDVVAVYKVYKQIAQLLNKLSTPLTQAILPQFAEMVARGEERSCFNYTMKIKNKSLKIMVPGMLLVGLLALPVMHHFLGPLYTQYWPALFLLLIARSYALSYTAIHPLFLALGEVKKSFWFALGTNVLFLGLSAVLVSKLSILGNVMALAIQYFLLINLKKWIMVRRFQAPSV